MDAIILTREEYQELLKQFTAIQAQLSERTKGQNETFVDNVDFMKMMHISKRTAQSWRDEGKIAFSQVGGKIYYKVEDIYAMLQKHYNKAFHK